MALFNRLFQSRKVAKSERNIQEDFKYVHNFVTIFYVHLITPQIPDFPNKLVFILESNMNNAIFNTLVISGVK